MVNDWNERIARHGLAAILAETAEERHDGDQHSGAPSLLKRATRPGYHGVRVTSENHCRARQLDPTLQGSIECRRIGCRHSIASGRFLCAAQYVAR